MKYISSLLLGAVAVASAQDIVDVADSNGFTTLVAAVTAAGLVATLQGDGPFTVFAPDDDAFAALPVGFIEYLLEPDSKDELTAVLLYHVLAGEVDSATAIGLDGSSVPTVGTENITISLMVDSLMINDATVIGADVEASNGVIHVIDKVLYPPSLGDAPISLYDLADEASVFTTLLAAANATGVTESILKDKGPYTILAPTDDAFDKLPDGTVEALLNDLPTLTKILAYHVIPGRVFAETIVTLETAKTLSGIDVTITVDEGMVFVNNAMVTGPDAFASNGLVHIIDTVLLPPTIFDLGVEAGIFTTLLAAVQAANLTSALTGNGPITLLAPTDEAFDKLPPGTVDLLLNDIDALTAILLYHVISGEVRAETIVTLNSAETLNGADVSIAAVGGMVMINDATVVDADVVASNGVVHVIDRVLLPPTETAAPTNAPTPSASSGAAFGVISTVSVIMGAIGCSMHF
eukprot:scaffold126343_cov57-Attheya_sp.AAC.2